MKTINELAQHLFEYHSGLKDFPTENELLELCSMPTKELTLNQKLHHLTRLGIDGKLPDWELNYINNAIVTERSGGIESLLPRQIEFISLVYEKNKNV